MCFPVPLLLIILATHRASALVTWQRKFDFFPIRSQSNFGPISSGPCNQTLATYDDQWNNRFAHPDLEGIRSAIQMHQQCILNNTSENMKATMASASILLGLVPVLLQTTGLSVIELGVLSVRRPLLSALLALGTATVYPARIFGYRESKAAELVAPPSLLPARLVRDLVGSIRLRSFISALQYLLAASSIANTLYTAYRLGVDSVNNFDCADSVLPLIWTMASLVIHIPTSLSFGISERQAERGKRRLHAEDQVKKEKTQKRRVKSLLQSETLLCVMQERLPDKVLAPNLISSSLHWFASVLGFVHGFVGVLIFTSLLFVQIGDAVTILLRFFASALACRAILAFELSGMRVASKRAEQEEQSIDKVAGLASSEHDVVAKGPTREIAAVTSQATIP